MSWPEAAVKIAAILVIGMLLLALFAKGARRK